METKHTKGEWIINKHSATTVELRGSSRSIASTGGYQTNGADSLKAFNENIANAKLIAAAPDLIEALYNLIEYAEFDSHIDNGHQYGLSEETSELITRGLNAIKKATE
jgi:hypothetical protein